MTEREQAWWKLAACRGAGPEMFFTGPGDPGAAEAGAGAKMCAQCPVSDACLNVCADEPFGIWGGLTASERRLLGSGGRAA